MQITNLKYAAFKNLKKLNLLILDGNPGIGLSSETFSRGLRNLKQLSLDFCNLKSLPEDVFDKLPSLTGVSLIGNPLTAMPVAVGRVPSLTIVDLSETTMRTIKKRAFDGAAKLQTLKLRSMPLLRDIEKCAFCGLTGLEV